MKNVMLHDSPKVLGADIELIDLEETPEKSIRNLIEDKKSRPSNRIRPGVSPLKTLREMKKRKNTAPTTPPESQKSFDQLGALTKFLDKIN